MSFFAATSYPPSLPPRTISPKPNSFSFNHKPPPTLRQDEEQQPAAEAGRAKIDRYPTFDKHSARWMAASASLFQSTTTSHRLLLERWSGGEMRRPSRIHRQ